MHFSNPDRENNVNKETFRVASITPLSESAAAVIFLKNTGKRAAAFYYLIKDKWRYFFPTDSHILGMERFAAFKDRVEAGNWKHNFPGATA